MMYPVHRYNLLLFRNRKLLFGGRFVNDARGSSASSHHHYFPSSASASASSASAPLLLSSSSSSSSSFSTWRRRQLHRKRSRSNDDSRFVFSSSSSSSFSTATSIPAGAITDSTNDLEAFTETILNGRRRYHPKLGTLTDEQWDDCFGAMLQWLQQSESQPQLPVSAGNDYIQHADADANNTSIGQQPQRGRGRGKLSGYDVDAVDRMLHRLLFEHAATVTTTSHHSSSGSGGHRPLGDRRRRRHKDLQDWMVAVLQAWLQVGQQSPTSYLAAERAQRVLDRILDWKERGWWQQGQVQQQSSSDISEGEEFPGVAECAGVIAAWLRLETPEGTERAIAMLVSRRYLPLLESDRGNSIALYHQALRQALESDPQQQGEIALELGGCMHALLAEDPVGWEGIQLDADEEALLLGNNNLLLADDRGVDSEGSPRPAKELSSFEQSALQKQLIGAVDRAKADDRATVEELVQKWSNGPEVLTSSSDNFSADLYRSLARYYIRIGDPRVATTWFLKLETTVQAPSSSSSEGGDPLDWRSQICQDLLDLWGRSSEGDAPWRADELLRRLEAMYPEEGGGSVRVPPSAYSTVSDLWISSGDSNASRKVLELCHRAPETLLRQTLQFIASKDSALSDDNVEKVIDIFSQRWDLLKDEERTSFVDVLANAISDRKLSSRAIALVSLLARNNTAPSATACERLAGAFSETSDPYDVLKLLDGFERCGAKLPFGCYKSAIDSLLSTRARPKFQATKQVLTVLLADVQKGLEVDVKELGGLLCRIVRELNVARRDFDAVTILEMAEEKLLPPDRFSFDSFPIPIYCYREVATACYLKGNVKKVEEIFERVLNYYDSGHDDMCADITFYNLYMASLANHGPATLMKRIELLEQLIRLYDDSGEDRHKPLERMFRDIFSDLKVVSNQANAERALSLTDQMVRLNVEVRKAFTLNSVMHTVQQSGMKNTFQHVMNVFMQFEKLQVPPDLFTLHNILKACGSADPLEKGEVESALSIALETLIKIRENGWTNETTYLLLLKVARKAKLITEYNDVVTMLFNSCCEDGWLSETVKEEFQKFVSRRAWKQLADGRDDEPEKWRRNVNRGSSGA